MTISTSSAQKTKKDLQKNAQNTKDNKKIQKDAAPTPKTGQSLALVLARPNMQPSVSSPVSNKRKHSPASTSPSLAATVFKLKSTATATTELLADFRNHRSAIKCIQCNNSSCVTATNIQQNEAILTCTLFTIVPALTGTNESLISEGDKLLLSNYHTIRHLLTCITCNKIGTINKNGHNKSVPPRPIFICKCGKTYSTDQIRILMDAYELPGTLQSSLPLVEDDEFEIEQIELDLGLDEDNLMQDSFVLPTLSTFSTSTDIPTTQNNNNNIINDLIQTINEMKQQLSRHDEQFVNFSGLMDQNKRLQREIIVQKREIDHLLNHTQIRQYRFNTPIPEQLEIASKAFDDSILTNPPDYQFVHFPYNVRVIDAHCPDYNVAEFLVHENYVDELRLKFRSARVETLDYD
ncbi:hypothetical protein INT47_010366 [Mucor saturninus]|uniref:Uncharacterized protein n=1 Tax=Mucor saturninus TaxID=64648 RepID=A0A8H7UW89_9FUNG|nr:hypothetical protein INT47_010366 [Mucor saturninus]